MALMYTVVNPPSTQATIQPTQGMMPITPLTNPITRPTTTAATMPISQAVRYGLSLLVATLIIAPT